MADEEIRTRAQALAYLRTSREWQGKSDEQIVAEYRADVANSAVQLAALILGGRRGSLFALVTRAVAGQLEIVAAFER